jgi:hypothetical protein
MAVLVDDPVRLVSVSFDDPVLVELVFDAVEPPVNVMELDETTFDPPNPEKLRTAVDLTTSNTSAIKTETRFSIRQSCADIAAAFI